MAKTKAQCSCTDGLHELKHFQKYDRLVRRPSCQAKAGLTGAQGRQSVTACDATVDNCRKDRRLHCADRRLIEVVIPPLPRSLTVHAAGGDGVGAAAAAAMSLACSSAVFASASGTSTSL